MGACATDVFRVLFCGEEFHWGYKFTKEALQEDAGIVVRCAACEACVFCALKSSEFLITDKDRDLAER